MDEATNSEGDASHTKSFSYDDVPPVSEIETPVDFDARNSTPTVTGTAAPRPQETEGAVMAATPASFGATVSMKILSRRMS